MRSPFATCVTMLVLMTSFVILSPHAAATIDTNASALAIAQAMFTDSTIITGASFVAKPPSGTPDALSDTPLTGFPTAGASYGIFTTGNASLAPTTNCCTNSGADDGGANVRGTTDYDVTILRIDFNVPQSGNCVSVGKFRFLSEEFDEYVGSSYNDAFIMEMDTSSWTTADSVISAPNNFAFDPNGDPISVNAAGSTSMSAGNATGTTYDGATALLEAKTPVTTGSHSLYISIFDQADNVYDSAAFVDGIEIQSVAPAQCQPGAHATEDQATCDAIPVAVVISAAGLGPFATTVGRATAATPEIVGPAIPAPATLSSPPSPSDKHQGGPILPVSYSDANVQITAGAAHAQCDVSAHAGAGGARSSQAYGRAGLEDLRIRLIGAGLTLQVNTIDYEQNGYASNGTATFKEGCHLVQLVLSPVTPTPASTLDSCAPRNTALSVLTNVKVTLNEVSTPFYLPGQGQWSSFGSAVHISVVDPSASAIIDVYLGLVTVGVIGVPGTVPAMATYVPPGPCAICFG